MEHAGGGRGNPAPGKTHAAVDAAFDAWLDALERRHLADLRRGEVNRALRALSDDYVHRRHRVASDSLAGRGKRAAFALFYGPLHYLVVREIARRLEIRRDLTDLVDLGCGTGAAGAALGGVLATPPAVLAIDRQGWTLEEAAFTYRHFGLAHRVVRGDVTRVRVRRPSRTLVAAAYLVNELDDDSRAALLGTVSALAREGASVLVVEPIAKRVAPWWGAWTNGLSHVGARADEHAFTDPLPRLLREMDRAAGLDHRIRKARTLWIAGHPRS